MSSKISLVTTEQAVFPPFTVAEIGASTLARLVVALPMMPENLPSVYTSKNSGQESNTGKKE